MMNHHARLEMHWHGCGKRGNHWWVFLSSVMFFSCLLSGCESLFYQPHSPTISDVAVDLEKGFLSFVTDAHGADECTYEITGWYILPDDPSQKHYAILFKNGTKPENGGFAFVGCQWQNGEEWQPLPPGTEYYFRIKATAMNYYQGGDFFDNQNTNTSSSTAETTKTEIWLYKDGVLTRLKSGSGEQSF